MAFISVRIKLYEFYTVICFATKFSKISHHKNQQDFLIIMKYWYTVIKNKHKYFTDLYFETVADWYT